MCVVFCPFTLFLDKKCAKITTIQGDLLIRVTADKLYAPRLLLCNAITHSLQLSLRIADIYNLIDFIELHNGCGLVLKNNPPDKFRRPKFIFPPFAKVDKGL